MMEYSIEDYSDFRFNRAEETIKEVKFLIDNKYWNTAIRRMYFACFYAIGALLIRNNIKISTHSGVRQKFGELFVRKGKFNRDLAKHYAELFEKRYKGDYNDLFDFDEKTVKRLYPLSRNFISKIGELLI